MKHSVMTLLSVVALLLASSAALAEEPWWAPQSPWGPGEFLRINFDGDTVGNPPILNTNEYPLIEAWDWLDLTGGTARTPPVVMGGTGVVDDVAGMTKACVFTTYNTDPVSGIVTDIGVNDVASNQMGLSFDIAVIACSPTITAGDPEEAVFVMKSYEGFKEQWAYFFVAVPTSETGGAFGFWNGTSTDAFGSYTNGPTKHNIRLAADFRTGKVDAYLDGTLALSDYALGGGITTDPRGEWTRELFSRVTGEPGYVNQVALDNISMYVPMAGDANQDAVVNVADLTNLLNNYNKLGMEWKNGDFTGDGTVNVNDLTALLNHYNKTVIGTLPPPALTQSMGTVPEPSSIALLAGLALTALLCWWRKRA